MCLFSYNVEISNRHFTNAARLLGGMKVVRSGKNYSVIETVCQERTILTRNGIPFSLVESKEDEE